MLHDKQSRRVAIIGYNRIPFARHNTAYTNASNQDMMTAAMQGLIERYGLHGELLGEVAGGAVIKHSHEFNLMRECVMGITLNAATPVCDIPGRRAIPAWSRLSISRTRSRWDRSR